MSGLPRGTDLRKEPVWAIYIANTALYRSTSNMTGNTIIHDMSWSSARTPSEMSGLSALGGRFWSPDRDHFRIASSWYALNRPQSLLVVHTSITFQVSAYLGTGIVDRVRPGPELRISATILELAPSLKSS